MAYVDDVTVALVRVFETAAFHKDPVRIAGYSANLDFWLGEAAHAMEVLEGYSARHARLKDARTKAAAERNTPIADTLVTPTVTPDEIGRLRDRLRPSSAHFFRLRTPAERAEEVEAVLAIKIVDRRRGVD
ncbi:MAG: hypothetical protein AAGJ46_15860 [Planctomycetota bacterium]